MNLKKHLALLLAAVSIALAGCAQPAQPAATVPPTTVSPATEAPDPVLKAGPGLTVDGTELSSVAYLGTAYASAAEFLAAAADITFSGDNETGFTAEKNGVTYVFLPDTETFLQDGEAITAEKPILTNYGIVYLPVEQFCQIFSISVVPDSEQNHIYCTSDAD